MQIIPQRFMPYHAKNYGENNCGNDIYKYSLHICVYSMTTLMRICELIRFSLPLSASAFHCIVIAIASNVESSRVDLGVLN